MPWEIFTKVIDEVALKNAKQVAFPFSL